MSDLKPINKMVLVKTIFGGEKTTEAGIIYKETFSKSRLVWSEVVAIGNKLTEDIQVGDRVLWDITNNKGNHYKEFDVIHQDAIFMVERN